MSSMQSLWVDAARVGTPWLPYFVLVVAAVLAIAILWLVLYLVWRVAKRVPPALRYLLWRLSRLVQSLRHLLSGAAQGASWWVREVGTSRSVPISLWVANLVRDRPLYLVLGESEAVATRWLATLGGPPDGHSSGNADGGDQLRYWCHAFGHFLLLPANSSGQSDRWASAIEQLGRAARRHPACDGLIAVATLAASRQAYGELARVGWKVGETLQVHLPVHLVLSLPDELPCPQVLVAPSGEVRLGLASRAVATLQPAMARVRPPQDAAGEWLEAIEQRMDAAVLAGAEVGDIDSTLILEIVQLRANLGEAVRDPVRLAFDQLFAASADPGSLLVCGGVALSFGQREGCVTARGNAREMLASAGSGRPTLAAQLHHRRRNQRARWALVAAATGVVLLAAESTVAVKRGVNLLEAQVLSLRNDLSVQGSRSAARGTCSGSAQGLQSILQTVATVESSRLRSMLAPPSWNDHIRGRAHELLGRALARGWIEPRLRTLADFSSAASQSSDDTLRMSASPVLRVEDLTAWKDLHFYVQTYDPAGPPIARARSVTYAQLLDFLQPSTAGVSLPRAAWQSGAPDGQLSPLGELPDSARVAMQNELRLPTTPGSATDGFAVGVSQRWRQVLEQGLSGHDVVRLSEGLVRTLDELSQGEGLDVQAAAALIDDLRSLRTQLRSPAARRITGNAEDAQQFFLPALTQLGMSTSVSAAMVAESARQVGKHHDEVRTRLLLLEVDGIGSMFVAGQDGVLKLSPEFDRLSKGVLAALVTAPRAPAAGVAGIESGQSRAWRAPPSDRARHLLSTRPKHIAAAGLGEPVRAALQAYLEQQYRSSVETALWQGARPADRQSDLASVVDRAQGLAAAADFYIRAVGKDGIAGDEPLTSALVGDALELLAQLRTALLTSDPYQDFFAQLHKDWRQRAQPRKPAAVASRLAFARESVREKYLSEAVTLLDTITVLQGRRAAGPALPFWRGLAHEFEQFDKNVPGNGIVELERAVLAADSTIAAGSCKTSADRLAVRSGYFGQLLIDFDSTLSTYCGQARMVALSNEYGRLSSWFNGHVAGHYPFDPTPQATPLATRTMLALLDRVQEARAVQQALALEWPPEASRFMAPFEALLRQLDARRPAASEAVGQVGVGRALRYQLQLPSNRSGEVLGEHIAEWRLTTGTREFRRKAEPQSFEWSFGERMEIRLRLAANSPYTPVPGPGYSLDGSVVTFAFTGDWALFSLAEQHRVDVSDPRVLRLRFAFEVDGAQGRREVVCFADLVAAGGDDWRFLDLPRNAPAIDLGS